MKYFIAFIIVFFLYSSVLFAQNPDTLKEVVPFSKFPIGAIRYDKYDTLVKMLGMNHGFSFESSSISSTMPLYAHVKDTNLQLKDPFNFVNPNATLTPQPLLERATHGHDVRVYMQGTSPTSLQEYTFSWTKRAGENWVTNPAHWEVKSTDDLDTTSDNYVLRDLNDGARYDYFYGHAHSDPSPDPNYRGKCYYDFIFNMKFEGFSLSGSDSLYQLEFWVKEDGVDTFRLEKSRLITKTLYDNLPFANSTVTGHTPDGELLSSWQGEQYRALRDTLDVRSFYHGNWDNYGGVQVDVRLRTFKRWNIFPRLLRIRDERGQRLLSGKADSVLKIAIDKLRAVKVGGQFGVNRNDKLKGWILCDEPPVKSFRALSFVNELLRDKGAPGIATLENMDAGNDYGLMLRVFRNQSSRKEGTAWFDWYPHYGAPWKTFSKDTATGEYGYNWGYFGPPIPKDIASDSAKLFHNAIKVYGDYDRFTDEYQNGEIGFASESGLTNGNWHERLLSVAKSCYEMEPNRKIPFYLMPQAYISPYLSVPWKVDSAGFAAFPASPNFWDDTNRTKRGKFVDSLHYKSVILPYLKRAKANHKMYDLQQDSMFQTFWLYRGSTIPELYHQAWMAVLYGVKGISYSAAIDDEFGQVGILDASDTKSQNRTKIRFKNELKSFRTNSSFLEPWSTNPIQQRGFTNLQGQPDMIEYRYTDLYSATDPIGRPHCPYPWVDSIPNSLDTTYTMYNRADSLVPLSDSAHFTCDGALEGVPGGGGLRRYIEPPPAFKGMFNGVRSVVVEELGPIAEKLSQLEWRGVVSWHKRTHATTYLARLPIKDVLTKKIPLKGGATDPDSLRFVDIGIFKDPVDSIAHFVALLNRRLWVDTNTIGALGKIDYREVSFKVDPSKFNSDYQGYTLWQVTDVATKKDTTIHVDSLYTLTLKPGQGRLLRIAPAFGLNLGRMSENLFNNGRHVAPVEPPLGAVAAYFTTYQRDGNIVVSYPVETPTGVPSKRNAGNPVDTVIDNSGKCFNPSIAYNQKTNVVGLTYRKVIPNADTNSLIDTTIILYRSANDTTPSKFSICDTIDRFTANRPYFSPPAIMPVNGNDTNTSKDFWIGYNHPTAGGVLTVVQNHTIFPKKNFFKSFAAHVQFVSLATHVPNDTVRIAFQESTTDFSAIYYAEGWINNGVQATAQAQIKDISSQNSFCINVHPQIAVSEDSTVLVTWEAVSKRCIKPGCARREFKHLVFNRTRSSLTGRWSPINQFTAIRDTLDSAFTSTYRTYPNIQVGMFRESSGPDEWQDRMRLMWNNEKTGQIAISRHFDLLPGKLIWREYQMIEPSLEPAMPHASLGKRVLEPMLYRHIPGGEDGLFDTRITRYDFPLVGVENTPLTWIRLKSNSNICFVSKRLDGVIGHVSVTRLDTTNQIPMRILPGTDGSTSSDAALGWDDKRLRTETFHLAQGDSLSFYRHLHIGMFDDGEISDAASQLYDSTDFIGIRIRLRKSSNDSILLQIDSCRLGMSYFTFSPTNAQQGWRSFSPPINFSDSVYISMEAFRAIPINEWSIVSGLRFNDDDFVPELPDTNPAYKRTPDNPTPSNYEGIGTRISINPNPFEESTKVTLETYKDIPLSVQVYNVLGGLVATLYYGSSVQEHYQFTLDNTTIRPGTYFVRVQAGNQVVTRKVQFTR